MTTKALERQGAARSRLALTAAQMLPGDLANSKILTAMSLFGFLLPEELRGLDRDGFDVAIAARFAVNEDSELSAEWIFQSSFTHYGQTKAPRGGGRGLREH